MDSMTTSGLSIGSSLRSRQYASRPGGEPGHESHRTNSRKDPLARLLGDDQVGRIRKRLLKWGRANFKLYPWRTEADPWLSLVAEFLLQRTRASQVDPVYRELRCKFPTARSLAVAGEGAARILTNRLGLHWRGPLLLKVARHVAQSGGRPPEALALLRELPGIGPYTASAWLSLHRGHRMTIIDSNVCRWLSRVTGLPYNRDPRHVKWVKELMDCLTPKRVFRDFNYALLDFTMTICVPRTPKCFACPLRTDCRHGSERLMPHREDACHSRAVG